MIQIYTERILHNNIPFLSTISNVVMQHEDSGVWTHGTVVGTVMYSSAIGV